jgi:hypothetical protein
VGPSDRRLCARCRRSQKAATAPTKAFWPPLYSCAPSLLGTVGDTLASYGHPYRDAGRSVHTPVNEQLRMATRNTA